MELDQLLGVLPEAHLGVAHLGQHVCGTWYAIIDGRPHNETEFFGQGPTAVLALCGALSCAGYTAEEDGA